MIELSDYSNVVLMRDRNLVLGVVESSILMVFVFGAIALNS